MSASDQMDRSRPQRSRGNDARLVHRQLASAMVFVVAEAALATCASAASDISPQTDPVVMTESVPRRAGSRKSLRIGRHELRRERTTRKGGAPAQ